MYVTVPDGVECFAKSGANPILADELLHRVRRLALDLQRRRGSHVEPRE
jgi:hypothetical protein